jgi:hypothetical protein
MEETYWSPVAKTNMEDVKLVTVASFTKVRKMSGRDTLNATRVECGVVKRNK